MKTVRVVAGVLAGAIVVVSWIVAFLVMLAGTWWAIRAFIAGDIVTGIFVFIFTAPAVAIAQTLVALVAIPLAALADLDS